MDLLKQALNSNDPKILQLALQLLDNPLYRFQPRPDQDHLQDQQNSFYQDRSDAIVVALGGNGSGKSFGGAARVVRFLAETPPPDKLTPFWVLSQNMELATATCWSQNLSHFIQPKYIQNQVWYSSAKGLPRSVVLQPHKNKNSWLIEFKSYDQGRQALQGANIGGFWLDEQCPFEIITEVLARTRKWRFTGNKTYTLTPVAPDIKLEEIAATPHPDWHFYRLNTRCNDTINPDFVRQIEANELTELIETRLTGAFAFYQGQIYKDFNPKLHVIEPITIPPQWTVFRGIDLGWSHCTACVWIARDHENKFYVFREYLQSQTYIEAHVKSINEGWDKFLCQGGTWIDSANAQVVAEMELHGLNARPAVKDVKAGIGTIQSLLRERRLFIFNNCENLIRQMRTYVWDDKRIDEPKKETATQLYDLCDALRYALHSSQQVQIKFEKLKLPEKVNKIKF